MKKFKKVSALILAMLILLLSVPTVSAFAASPDRYGRAQLGLMPNGARLQQIYDSLVTSCTSNEAPELDINENWEITAGQLEIIYQIFYCDYPEYFWLQNGGYSYYYSEDYGDDDPDNDIVVGILPAYIEAFTDLAAAKSIYNAKVNSFIKGLSGKSEYEKAKILHDRLADAVDYEETPKDQSSYGALVEGKAVCNGYARAYQHLLQEVGIDSWYVFGASYEPNSGNLVYHAWNIVKIDNEWYHTDVTWDDQDENLFYSYFNITTKKLKEDHFIGWFEDLLPNATATAANYFVKENLVFTSFDAVRIAGLLNNSEYKTQIFADCYIPTFVQSVIDDMPSILEALSIEEECLYTIYQLGNSLIIDLDVACNHEYTNGCDKICNICGQSRKIPEHSYSDCFKTSQEELYGSWQIKANDTGIFKIAPLSNYTGNFSDHYIALFDSDGGEIKYNDAKHGWPLLKSHEYTIKFRYNCQDEITGQITWYSDKEADTIFPDTSSSGWYNDAVIYAVGKGIINGYSNGLFGPSDSIQRQDFLVMLARYDGVDLSAYQNTHGRFRDVGAGSYYEAAVNWGAEKGIVSGYQNGNFGVSDTITREQLVTFLYRYANYKGIDVTYSQSTKQTVSSQYNDYGSVSDWAENCVLWAMENSVIKGKNPTTIMPQGDAQRCEVAQIMYNIYLNNVLV